MSEPTVLTAAIGRYPHVAAVREGRVASDLLRLDFVEVSPISRAFAPMVRDLRFDVCEIAIATFLQAKAAGVPIRMLPVIMAARYQEAALLCRTDSDISGPADLAGRRIGVRAYAQTTCMWLRGILSDRFGLTPDRLEWVTFEEAHVRGVVDPPWAVRAAAGKDLMGMLRDGEVDAVIVGNDVPDDPGLRTVFADPAAAQHGLMPVNHVLCVTEARQAFAGELTRMFGASDVEPSVALALRYCQEQEMVPKDLGIKEVLS